METTSFLSKTHNWKSHGRDRIPNYWLDTFPSIHNYGTKNFNTIIELKQMPDWLTTVIMYLLNQKILRNHKNY
jgi:hypothetical protein